MQKAYYFMSGLIMALGPILGLGALGVLLYMGYPTFIGGILGFLILAAGILIGRSIFKKVQIVGPIEVMTALYATPELDNLKPGDDSETRMISTDEYVISIKNKTNLFKGGSMRIYGDWFGQPYSNNHRINGADYDSLLQELTINFSDGAVLTIENPKNIFEASTFMKIIDANSIKLEFPYVKKNRGNKSMYYLLYSDTGSKVKSETNIDWYKPKFDTSLGDPAIVIYGQFEETTHELTI